MSGERSTLGICVLLLAIVLYQAQQLNAAQQLLNNESKILMQMQGQAQGAIDTLIPSFSKSFDAQLDTKLKRAEDQFVSRMQREIPRTSD